MKKVLVLLCLAALTLTLCSCGEKTQILTAYVEDELSIVERQAVQSSILAIDAVQQAVYVSGEEALDAFIAQHGDDEAFADIDTGLLQGRFMITVRSDDMEAVAAQIEAIEGVEKVILPMKINPVVKAVAWLQELFAE